MNETIILDETNGKSERGMILKNLSNKYNIPYFTNMKEVSKYLED